jgi:cytosine/adenosine deaminase-related metal-dependent hydrolase
LCGGEVSAIVDRYVIAGGRDPIRDVYVGGVRVVEAGRHVRRDAIGRRFRATLARLERAAK